ncbi:uncharacterized protein LOC125672427 [Ostrea edulis]|uniref:uncharacterized protein LOC125672427 n=1 Tax=Ostrea edulis TaxID=37623 RepID=UPI0024AFBA9B|nr:uncharacterized protein LOC125672427 [Ostrea edulis]
MALTYSHIVDIYNTHKDSSNYMQKLQREICHALHVNPAQISRVSLVWKVKKIVKEMTRLNRYTNKDKYHQYGEKIFILPSSKRATTSDTTLRTSPADVTSPANATAHTSQPVTSENVSSLIKTVSDLTIKMQHLKRENLVLKDKLKSINTRNSNRNLKRKKEKIDLMQQELNVLKQREFERKKVKNDKGVQCNIFKKHVENLKNEIDVLMSEKETYESEDFIHVNKFVDFRDDSKGKPYNFKLRNLYYIFRSRNIGIVHIGPIVESVLDLFDIHVKNLPSKSTVAVLTSEMGVLSRIHVNEEIKKSNKITMHRDATTKKGKHYYGVQINTGDKLLTTGIRQVCDGKGETYVNTTKEILSDISSKDCDTHMILDSISCFMTDRSATEQKVNDIFSQQISHDVHSFKCAIHPLLQFSDVCFQEVFNIEKELNVKFESYSSCAKEPFTMFLLRCVSKFFLQRWNW